jgi:large subunit ribosomal protein L13
MKTHEVDATNQSMGRLASHIASLLRGKDSASYKPNQVPNIEVIVSNIDKMKFTGKKFSGKKYYHYSGYPGGMKTRTLQELWEKNPKEVVRKSVYRMLPVNRLRDKTIKNLKFK